MHIGGHRITAILLLVVGTTCPANAQEPPKEGAAAPSTQAPLPEKAPPREDNSGTSPSAGPVEVKPRGTAEVSDSPTVNPSDSEAKPLADAAAPTSPVGVPNGKAAGASPPPGTNSDAPLEVTVVGTRTEQHLDESPAAVSIVSRRDIQNKYVPTFDDAIKREPGVWMLKYRGPVDNHGMTVMRGVYGQNRTLLMLDGIPINGVLSGEIPWSNFPVETLDHIEIGRGPFSALYGGYAMAGIIDTRTFTPQTDSVAVRFGYGTFDTKSIAGTAGARVLNDRVALLVGLEHFASDGYRGQETRKSAGTTQADSQTAVTGWIPSTDVTGKPQYVIGDPGDNPSTRTTALAKLTYDISPVSHLSLLGLYGEWTVDYPNFRSYLRDSSGGIVTSGAVNLDGKVSTVSLGDFMSVSRRQDAQLGGVRYDSQLSPSVTLEVTGAVVRQYSRELEYRVVPTSVVPEGRNWSPRENQSLGFYGGANTSIRFDSHNTLTSGISANAADGVQRVTLVPDRHEEDFVGTLSRVGGRQLTGAVYAQHELKPIEELRFYGGVRLDVWHNYDGYRRLPAETVQTFMSTADFDARTQVSANPKASVVFLPAAGTTLRASAGTAFRPPTISELYGGSAHGGTQTFGDPGLKPERIASVEVGAVQRIGKGTRIEATFFANFVSDLIFAKTTSEAGAAVTVKQYDNAGDARILGTEIVVRQRLFPFVDLFGNYTFTRGTFRSFPSNPIVVGKRLPYSPEHMYNIGLDLHQGPFRGLLTLEGVSDAFAREDNADTVNGVPQGLDPYATLDAKVSYKLFEHLRLSLAATNLTDERYWLSFGRSPGRTFFADATFSL